MYVSLCVYAWVCAYCVCAGEGVEQRGIKDVVHESLHQNTFAEEGRSNTYGQV